MSLTSAVIIGLLLIVSGNAKLNPGPFKLGQNLQSNYSSGINSNVIGARVTAHLNIFLHYLC